jgi:hypothetical protein
MADNQNRNNTTFTQLLFIKSFDKINEKGLATWKKDDIICT